MLSRLQKRRGEDGFTLIELLVVIIIIGILAAIAIPVFLNQRRNAWDSAVESDLRNAATAQESHLVNAPDGNYADTIAELTAAGFEFSPASNYFGGAIPADDAAFIPAADAGNSYCITATSASGTDFEYDSATGLAPGDCT